MRLVRTWCKIPTRDSQEFATDLQCLLEHKELREHWSKGWNRWKPTNYKLSGYQDPWKNK